MSGSWWAYALRITVSLTMDESRRPGRACPKLSLRWYVCNN